ncbi:MAG: uracil-DNA glycosylase [Planctomycetes bacterium]|nr:uracil-DNA glycosylase [Planctomycetota bacterium]MBI3844378.1 uracil-DNA glycosylase [Planctomycetota bacterium]
MQLDLFARESNDVLAATTYDEFRRRLLASNCRRCPLWEGRTNLVVDRGNPRARVMAIGEAPGANEDRQGVAFVGRAGRLLDDMLAEIGIDSNRDLLIANVVKSRPPGNRPPTADEAAACLPYLRKQIDLVKPKLILLLGATALKHMLRDKKPFSMKDEVGKVFTAPEFPGTSLMVLYHPAYILRDPRKRPEMAAHLQTVRRLLGSDPGRRES